MQLAETWNAPTDGEKEKREIIQQNRNQNGYKRKKKNTAVVLLCSGGWFLTPEVQPQNSWCCHLSCCRLFFYLFRPFLMSGPSTLTYFGTLPALTLRLRNILFLMFSTTKKFGHNFSSNLFVSSHVVNTVNTEIIKAMKEHIRKTKSVKPKYVLDFQSRHLLLWL